MFSVCLLTRTLSRHMRTRAYASCDVRTCTFSILLLSEQFKRTFSSSGHHHTITCHSPACNNYQSHTNCLIIETTLNANDFC